MDQKTFLTIPAGDLGMYYNHTMLRAQVPSRKFRWYSVVGFSGDHGETADGKGPHGGQVKVSLMEQESAHLPGKMIGQFKLTEVDWDFHFPETGLYNFKNGVLLLNKVPVRASQKGLNSQNFSVWNLMSPAASNKVIPKEMFEANNFMWTSGDFNTLLEETTEIPFAKGIAKIDAKQIFAYAVDRRIAISQGMLSKMPTIWLKNRIVGEMNFSKEYIYPLHDLFIPELEQSLSQYGFNIA